jgi:hypothetical protein
MTFQLSPRSGSVAASRYTPDFAVTPVWAGDPIRLYEVKAGRKRKSGNIAAHFQDGAREKLLWAAREFPEYEWWLAWVWKGKWEEERIS